MDVVPVPEPSWSKLSSAGAGFDGFVSALSKGIREAPGVDLVQGLATCNGCSSPLGRRMLIAGVPMVLGMILTEIPKRVTENMGNCPACGTALKPEDVTDLYTSRIPIGTDACFVLRQSRADDSWAVQSLHAFTPPDTWQDVGFPFKCQAAVDAVGRVFHPLEPLLLLLLEYQGGSGELLVPISREAVVAAYFGGGESEQRRILNAAQNQGLPPPLKCYVSDPGSVPACFMMMGAEGTFLEKTKAKPMGIATVFSIPRAIAHIERWAQRNGTKVEISRNGEVTFQRGDGRFRLWISDVCEAAVRGCWTFAEAWDAAQSEAPALESFETALEIGLQSGGKPQRHEIILTTLQTILLPIGPAEGHRRDYGEADFAELARMEGAVAVPHRALLGVGLKEGWRGRIRLSLRYRDNSGADRTIEGDLELPATLAKSSSAIGIPDEHVKRIFAEKVHGIYARHLKSQ